MNDAWEQRGDDIEDADYQKDRRLAHAEKCLTACAGLPDGAIDGGWTAAGICAYTKRLEEKLAKEKRQFKNFHELLCERFGYCHDAKDWKRDRLSLVEHISKKMDFPAIPGGALGKLGQRLSEILDGEDFANIEPLLFAAAHTTPQPVPAADVQKPTLSAGCSCRLCLCPCCR